MIKMMAMAAVAVLATAPLLAGDDKADIKAHGTAKRVSGTTKAAISDDKADLEKHGTMVKTKGKVMPSPAASSAKKHWVCPMHDGGEGDKAGKCPKCGMSMVLDREDKAAAPAPEASKEGKK